MSSSFNRSLLRRNFYALCVGRFVDELMATENVFKEKLDRTKVIVHLTEQMETLPLKKFLTIPAHAFRQQVGQFMAMQLSNYE
jgi:hypothetical protein